MTRWDLVGLKLEESKLSPVTDQCEVLPEIPTSSYPIRTLYTELSHQGRLATSTRIGKKFISFYAN